jgi:glycosyltransferase involved in cell wall biosynthesis
MAAEVPLVAADIPVFREIAGDAAFYADPHRSDELAAAMAAALLSPVARETLIKRGRERLREFSWDGTANRLLSLFENVLAKRATARLRRRAYSSSGEMLEQASA